MAIPSIRGTGRCPPWEQWKLETRHYVEQLASTHKMIIDKEEIRDMSKQRPTEIHVQLATGYILK